MKTIIHLNQIGYITNLSKTATVITNTTSFSICEKASGTALYSGKLTDPIEDIASGDITRTADFSDFQMQGEYYLKVGSKKSYPFKIENFPYYALEQDILKAFYYNRCGITIHKKFAGIYRRKKCHTAFALLDSDPSISLDVTGGWHDAGDYARYTITAATTVGHLLYAYEFFPKSFENTVNIPESGNGTPDILNECRYELDWLLKMQAKDGGVYHKVSSKNYPNNIMPCDDEEQLFVFDKSSAAAANFAAVTALAARIYELFDSDFSIRLRIAAGNAWIWLLNNPNRTPSSNIDRVMTLEYSDRNFYDDTFWAAAELYRLTGDQSFNEKVCEIYDRVDTTACTWNSVGGFGAVSYIFSDKPKDALVLDALKTAFIYKSDNIVSMSHHSGYGTAKQGNRYLWGSNMEIMTFAMALIVADSISPNDDYITAALEQLNYILGKNPMGISYVTSFGSNFVSHPHHRPCSADEIDDPIKGFIVGGPDMLRTDEHARWLIKKGTPPAKCYVDMEYSYSTNEVAIYWNSPAIFVLGFLNKKYKSQEEPQKNDIEPTDETSISSPDFTPQIRENPAN